ncbi:MAG: Crp/Fnr family transcriptional regulator [Actinobacteria bacterium]|nr:Crp/Fnr family transcriptional regulator [Actinomycetota bacterium]
MSDHDARWVAKHLGRSAAALFTPAEVEALAPKLSSITLDSGDVLFERGSDPAGVWIIQSGWIELLEGSTRTDGVIALLGPLQCAGDIPLMLRQPAPYRACAVTESSCLFMSANEFGQMLATNPKFLLRLATKLAGRVSRVQGRVVEMLGKSLTEQVARVLLHESHDGTFAFSQEMCAAMLGASRAPVNQVLKDLERRGVVKLGYAHIDVVDEDALTHIAHSTTNAGS